MYLRDLVKIAFVGCESVKSGFVTHARGVGSTEYKVPHDIQLSADEERESKEELDDQVCVITATCTR